MKKIRITGKNRKKECLSFGYYSSKSKYCDSCDLKSLKECKNYNLLKISPSFRWG